MAGKAPKDRNRILASKTSRKRLPFRERPYFSQVATGIKLGYATAKAGPGSWIREGFREGTKLYTRSTIGEADDVRQADGKDVFSYEQAFAIAASGNVAPNAPLLVRQAMETYLRSLGVRKGESAEKDARQRSDKHIIPTLGGKRGDRLTLPTLEQWRDALVPDTRKEDEDDAAFAERQRKAKDSANRIVTILKAALNKAFEQGLVPSDSAWRRLKPFRGVAGRRMDHFDAKQARLLIAKAATFDQAFAHLCEAGFLTGARLSELVDADVRDFDAKRGTLAVNGKTGARIVVLTDEGVAFFKRIAKNKLPTATLLPDGTGNRWGKSTQARPFKRAAALAELPTSASFYSLRHSYISRAIESLMPLSIVAENCGTSLLMIQQNYQHVLAHTRRETINATAPKLRRVK